MMLDDTQFYLTKNLRKKTDDKNNKTLTIQIIIKSEYRSKVPDPKNPYLKRLQLYVNGLNAAILFKKEGALSRL